MLATNPFSCCKTNCWNSFKLKLLPPFFVSTHTQALYNLQYTVYNVHWPSRKGPKCLLNWKWNLETMWTWKWIDWWEIGVLEFVVGGTSITNLEVPTCPCVQVGSLDPVANILPPPSPNWSRAIIWTFRRGETCPPISLWRGLKQGQQKYTAPSCSAINTLATRARSVILNKITLTFWQIQKDNNLIWPKICCLDPKLKIKFKHIACWHF